MGKASVHKLIRTMAAKMPVLNILKPFSEQLTGRQLIAKGIIEVQGQPVEENTRYIHRTQRPVPADHVSEMKRLYDKYGQKGIQGYVFAIDQEEKKIAASKEKLLEAAPTDVPEITDYQFKLKAV